MRSGLRAVLLPLGAVVAVASNGDRYISLGLGATPEGSVLSTATKDLFDTHRIDNWGSELIRADPDAYDVVFHDTDADLFVRLDTPAGGTCLLHLDANPVGRVPTVQVFQMDGLKCRVEESKWQRSHWAVHATPAANFTCDWNNTECAPSALLRGLQHPGSEEETTVMLGLTPVGSKLSAAAKDLFGTHSMSNYGSAVDRQTDARFEISFYDSDGTAFLRLDAPQGGSCLLLVDANSVGPKPVAMVFQMSGLKCAVTNEEDTWSVSAEAAEGYRCDWNSFRCASPAAVLGRVRSDEEDAVVVRAATTGTKLSAATKDLLGTHPVSNYGSKITQRANQWFEITFDVGTFFALQEK